MRVDEIMAEAVVTVRPDTPVKQAAALLVSHDVSAVPVVAADGVLVGVVSGIDLVRQDVGPDPRAHMIRQRPSTAPPEHVADVMSHHVVTTHPHSDVADAVALMDRHRLRSLPVVDEGRIVGMLSRSDVLRALARSDEELAAAVRRRLEDCYGRDATDVAISVDQGLVVLSLPSEEVDPDAAVRVAETVPGVVRARTR